VWAKAESLSAIPVTEIRAEGERVLVIRAGTPFAPLPGFLCDYAGIILAPSAYDGQGQPQRQIATGPYRMTAVSGTGGIEAEAFPGHRGATPATPRLSYSAVVLGDTRASMAEAGEADLVFTLLAQAAERIEAAGRGHIIRTTIPRPRMIDMNLKLSQFADVRVGRAMSLTIDREGIANAVLRDKAGVATQLLPPVLAGWYDPSRPPLHRDVAEAKRLLAETGWTAGADSTLAKDGQKLQANMMMPSNRPEIPLMA
jgi:peptide/nickel transport system substrate-binding protein